MVPISAPAWEGRKIESFSLTFDDGVEFKAEPMAALAIDRGEIVSVCLLPDGVDGRAFEAQLHVYEDARSGNHNLVRITVEREQR